MEVNDVDVFGLKYPVDRSSGRSMGRLDVEKSILAGNRYEFARYLRTLERDDNRAMAVFDGKRLS